MEVNVNYKLVINLKVKIRLVKVVYPDVAIFSTTAIAARERERHSGELVKMFFPSKKILVRFEIQSTPLNRNLVNQDFRK